MSDANNTKSLTSVLQYVWYKTSLLCSELVTCEWVMGTDTLNAYILHTKHNNDCLEDILARCKASTHVLNTAPQDNYSMATAHCIIIHQVTYPSDMTVGYARLVRRSSIVPRLVLMIYGTQCVDGEWQSIYTNLAHCKLLSI